MTSRFHTMGSVHSAPCVGA